MLFGMAGYRSGFLTGDWSAAAIGGSRSRRSRSAASLRSALGLWVANTHFYIPLIFFAFLALGGPIQLAMAFGYASLIILFIRPGGALTGRFAAVGRAAFSNYLGTSLVAAAIFYGDGLGLFGRLSRAEAWLVVPAVWAIMLLWSKPWLDRFRYGPLEWAWRSLARLRLQPMRKRPPIGAIAPAASPRRYALASDPAEALVGGLAPEAPRRGARQQRVGRLVEQLDRLVPQRRSSTTSAISSLGKLWVSMLIRADCSISSARRRAARRRTGALRLSACAPESPARRCSARASPLDRRDALHAVLAEIAEDADEARPSSRRLCSKCTQSTMSLPSSTRRSRPAQCQRCPHLAAKGKEGVYSSLLSYGFLGRAHRQSSGTGPNCRSRRIELSR
jgi:hypothetical protein